MEKNKVSVIIPVYNVESYLEECLESIITQSYNLLEIILVDDGSTDSSSEICDKYADIDQRVIVIHKSNGGLSSARNAGINVAKGEFLFFVDSDDCIHKETIKILLDNLLEANVDVSMCDFLYKERFEGINIDTTEYSSMIYDKKDAISAIYQEDSVKMIVVWNKLYRKKVFKNLNFVEGVLHEDQFFVHRMLLNIDKIIFIKLPLYFYRKRLGSTMNEQGDYNIKHLDVLDALIDRIQVMHTINDELYYKAINAFLDSTIYCYGKVKTKKEIQQKLLILYKEYYLISKSKGLKSLKYKMFSLCPNVFSVFYMHFGKKRGLKN